jgi:hypothetical protein
MVHCGNGFGAHRPDIRKAVRGSYSSKTSWIVNDGKEEINSLNQSDFIGNPVHTGIIHRLHPDNKIRGIRQGQFLKNSGQPGRIQFTCSTGTGTIFG